MASVLLSFIQFGFKLTPVLKEMLTSIRNWNMYLLFLLKKNINKSTLMTFLKHMEYVLRRNGHTDMKPTIQY